MRYIYNQLSESEMDVSAGILNAKPMWQPPKLKWVFQYYPQSEAIPESIATIAYSYDKLGNDRYRQSI